MTRRRNIHHDWDDLTPQERKRVRCPRSGLSGMSGLSGLSGLSGIMGGAFSPPTVVSLTIDPTGTMLTEVFSEAVNCSSAAGLTITNTTQSTTPTLTYASGSGTSSLVFTIGTAFDYLDAGTLAYDATLGNIVSTVGNTPLATFGATDVTNDSLLPANRLIFSGSPVTLGGTYVTFTP